jgi:phosphoglycolate phosphatase-like HAD superfamily hydrolase
MKLKIGIIAGTIALIYSAINGLGAYAAVADPLPSWNDGKSKSAIVHFVEDVTNEKGPSFVPQAERIATFDNDGTLWVEQPMYVQLLFALERVKALAPQHPAWKTTEPFKSTIAGDLKAVMAGGEKALAEIVIATHSGMTPQDFEHIDKQWLATAKNARFKRPYTELTYQPMLELLAYLRSNGFKTYIVTGGGVEFVRAFSEKSYGVPPEQVIGSSAKLKFEYLNGKATIVRLPAIDFIDDKDGKPIGIQKFIGRRPIAAFGNSDGDLQMLQWTSASAGPHFCLFVHHTDAVREYAYDRTSKIGKLDKGLDAAAKNDWTVVDMKNDWKSMFPTFPASTGN